MDGERVQRFETIAAGGLVPKYRLSGSEGFSRWRTYNPLEDTPDLFLKLASVYEACNFAEAALAFTHKYGGLYDVITHPGLTDDRTSLSSWWEEAERAWVILKLYEAALNRDGGAVRDLYATYGNGVLRRSPLDLLRFEKEPHSNERIAHIGLIDSVRMVEETEQLLCRRTLQIGEGGPPLLWGEDPDPFKVQIVWQFDSLVGAIYLQMYWLMASNDDLGRCENCGRIFFLARAHPEGRKRRRDKRFCDDACRQAHHRSKKKG